MMMLKHAMRQALGAINSRTIGLLLTALVATLMPQFALASGGENVVLNFTDSDKIYLYISLGFGVIALAFGWILAKGVLAQSAGSAKMQEVGQAIRDGALAYLRQQIRTMSVFVVVLFIGLIALYNGKFGTTTAVLMGLCFIGGVAASYIAGYAGMIMAVSGNMRTAHAALTTYKGSLEVAFRSGAVAGMVTVGMGLIGATLILLFAGESATKLLVGFGFGGSLAALFMRVGGGIFTKAADVGADLVGKVEAGIPEDDPRNPAVIADNVGDNVGDCAGMAADVFESYEVTLVAAIVLGAATAAIFDTSTWTKLVLFALMARGVGIIASIIGVLGVKGSEDLDSDPLTPIRRGFYISAAVATAATAVLAYFMMGGDGKNPVTAVQLISSRQYEQNEARDVQALREKLATAEKKQPYEIAPAKLLEDKTLTDKGFSKEDQRDGERIQVMLNAKLDRLPKNPSYAGYEKVTAFDEAAIKTYPGLGYAIQSPPGDTSGKPFTTVAARFGNAEAGKKLVVAQIKVKADIPGQPARGNVPATPAQKIDRITWIGPIARGELDKQIADQKKFMTDQKIPGEITEQKALDVAIYANRTGGLVLGVEGEMARPHTLQSVENLNYFPVSVATMEGIDKEARANPSVQPNVPAQQPMELAVVQKTVVPWWTFFLAIAFGVVMAFAIEILTDYYVSTEKRPTREVAGVATAGPAPMIIQGFAYACESSVFLVFAIVIALLFPLFLFNPLMYGGYLLSFYGIALVGLGLLTTTGYVLAMDTFGPISDNAQGIYEMSGEGHDNPRGSRAVQRLDAAGNTTKALTKGFAIATAVVAAVALFHSYLEDAKLSELGLRLDIPEIFLGLMIGGAAPFLFSAFAINAVGRSAFELINDVRNQFRNDPGIMAGTSKPDYARCVAIVTKAAQKELLGPGILAIALPAAVAFGFSIGKEPVMINGQLYNLTGAQALGGFLAGTILSGQLLAVLLANSGGMWDNAKKLIEDGMHGGKGTDAHKAAVVCDTVGDPFKDTAGPALNPLIKVMNLVALLLASVIIQPLGPQTLVIVTLVCLGLLAFSVYNSKKGSMSTALTDAIGMEAALPGGGTVTVQPEAPAVPKRRITVEDDGDKTE